MKYLLIFLFLFGWTINIHSQDSLVIYQNREFHGKRPKVGLVLSGGGAKGMAHVGILKVLDSLGIKPDYISGTSMGSIVGGLYAIGFSADSLEKLVVAQNWDEILSNNSDFRTVNIVEKEDYDNYFEFPVTGWKPDLPQGAIKGQEMELLFNKLTVSVAKDTDFDDFSIPYRAVAVDILTGKPYVFHSGNLATAMRASMSIPTVMAPVKYKGMLLVDGGLMENFPVNICKEMGADIIIGVYTGAELISENKLNSMINVLKQSSLIAGINSAVESRKKVDLYIEPYLSDLSVANFNDAEVKIERGYNAAMAKIDEFVLLRDYLNKYPKNNNQRSPLRDSVFITSYEIEFDQRDWKFEKVATNSFKNIDNQWLKPDDINKIIQNVYGTRLFKKLSYDFYPSTSDSGVTLKYIAVKEYDKHLLLSLQYKNESKMGVNVGFRYRNLIIPGSKIEVKFRISENPGAKLNLFSYIGNNIKKGVDFSYYFKKATMPYYEDRMLISQNLRYFHSWNSSFHYFFNSYSEIKAGVGYERVFIRKIMDVNKFSYPKIRTKSVLFPVKYSRITLDKKFFATTGSKLNLSASFYSKSYTYYYYPEDSLEKHPELNEYEVDSVDFALKIMFNYHHFLPLNNKLVLTNEVDAFLGLGYLYSVWVGGVNPDEDFQLPFWGLPENADMISNGWIYRIGLRYEFAKQFYLTGKINTGFLFDEISQLTSDVSNPDGRYSSIYNYENYMFGGGLQVSYNSIIGPVSLAVTKSINESNFFWHLLIGYSF